MVIQDHVSPDNKKAYFASLAVARDYDNLVSGSTTIDFMDLKSLWATVKVQVPTTYTVARLMLKAYVLVLAVLLGETHPVVMDMAAFVSRFTNKESFYVSHLQVADSVAGPMRLVCHIQPQTRAWFLDVASCIMAAAVARVTAPNFNRAWRLTTVGDMLWLQTVPLSYQSSKSGRSGLSASGDDKEKKKPMQVHNTTPSTCFEDFKTGITKAKFNKVIKKVGSPPKVKRDGEDVDMCVSWH